MSVLDIGTWDGYFSFAAEKRGAERVLAIDSFSWQKEFADNPELIPTFPDPERKGFEHAKKILNSKVEFREIELMDLDKLEKFDLVLCLGILYHVKDPWAIINHLGIITKKMLILETHTNGDLSPVPMMIFYPDGWQGQGLKDYSTYWGMNILCIIEMLKKAGFKDVYIINRGENRVFIHAYK
jgi:tRNA (mo5U34)-methyltransferase